LNFLASINPLYSVSGLAVGILVGLTGVGGGSLMTPLLILLFGIHPATAVGTDLLYAAATKSCGTLIHGFGRTVIWRIVALLAAGSVPATVLTVLELRHLTMSGAANHIMSVSLGVALLATATVLFLRKQIIAFYAERIGVLSEKKTAILTVVLGAVLGVLVSLSSVGAGALGVTALILLYPQLSTARIVGSDIAHAVPLTLIAGLGHWLLGSIDWLLLGSLLIGSIPGIAIGSYGAGRVPERVLQIVLGLTLVAVAAKLML
jgi:hypothetical protein